MYKLKPETKRNIECCVNLPYSKLVNMDYSDEKRFLKPISAKEVAFPATRDARKIGRGNPYLARRRFRTMEEVDKKLSEISNANSQQ